MSLTPAPFLRFGFVFLAFCVALAVGVGQAPAHGTVAWIAAAVAFAGLGGIGELMFRRISVAAAVVKTGR